MSQEDKSKTKTIADDLQTGASIMSAGAAVIAAIATLIRTFGKK